MRQGWSCIMHSVFVVRISLSVFRETHIMFLIQPCLSSEEQLWVGRGVCVLLVHSEIYYVPIGDGWTEVLVRNCAAKALFSCPAIISQRLEPRITSN